MAANFVKIGAVKSTLLRAQISYVIVFYTFRPIWTKFGMGGIHQNLLENYEFRKKRQLRPYFIKGRNKLTLSVLSTFYCAIWLRISLRNTLVQHLRVS